MTHLADDLYPEVLLDLRDKLAALLVGHVPDQAEAVAFGLCEHLRHECSGRIHCLPKGRRKKAVPAPLPGQDDMFDAGVSVEANNPSNAAIQDLPPLVAEVREHGRTLLLEQGVAPDLAEQISVRVAELFKHEWQGERVYIPKGQQFDLARRDEAIFRAATPDTMAQLCRKYGLTEQRIYQIQRKELRRRQRKLF